MGVTYYLAPEAVTGTLARVADLSAPGSELILDYMNVREGVPADELALFDSLLRFVEKHGEPMISRFDPGSVVDRMGLTEEWDVLRHEFPAADPSPYLGSRTDLPRVAPLFRLLHLRKR